MNRIRAGQRVIGVETASKADVVYISHAHSDHLIKTKKPVLASAETFSFLEQCVDYAPSYMKLAERIEGIELVSSGHILGSTQMRYTNGSVTVFTGDMKLRDGFTTKGAEPLQCDTLHIDCTFGDRCFSFGSREEIANSISKWTKEKLKHGNVVFGAYQTGKAQELIRIINEFVGESVIVDEAVEKRCKVYEQYGVRLDRLLDSTDEGKEAAKDHFVSVLPFHRVNGQLRAEMNSKYVRPTVCALATGWAVTNNFDIYAFPLSDHGDFSEILDYVQQSGARRIVCEYAHGHIMARELRKLGYDAVTAAEEKQEQLKKESQAQLALTAYNV